MSSTASYRSKKTPVIIESEPPKFPRPSSSIARSRLKNRLLKSTPNSNNALLPVPPKNDHDDEFRHHIHHEQGSHMFHDEKSQKVQASGVALQKPEQDSVGESNSVHFGSTDVVESFGWRSGEEATSLPPPEQRNTRTSYLHSKIIPSHSLYVPGYESTVPRPPVLQQMDVTAASESDPSTVVLSSAYGKSFQSNAMEDAVELILSGEKEFCYLEAVDPDDAYRLVLSFNDVSKKTDPGKYITLSANGVVRYYEDGMDSVSLRSYLREYKFYYQLMQIPVIGQFRKWKSFLILKKFVLASRRKKRMAFLYPHLFILDKSFQTMLLYANQCAALLNEREAARLSKVLFKITSPSFFEIQDTLAQNKSPITKSDLALKKFEAPGHSADVDSSSSYKPKEVTKAMSKEEIMFHIVCCIHQKVSSKFGHVSDLVPQSLLESNFRHQSSIDMIATREADRSKSFTFEKVAKKNILKKAQKAASRINTPSVITTTAKRESLLASQLPEEEDISYTQRSANRLNCRRIASAVKIVDFVVRDYLYLAAEASLASFLAKCKLLRCSEVKHGDIGLKMVIRDLRRTDGLGEGDEEKDLSAGGGDGESDDGGADLNLLALYGIDTSFPPPVEHELNLELYPNKVKALNTLHELVTEIFNACRHETSLLHHDMLKDIFRPISNEIDDWSILDLIYFDEQNSIHDLTNQIASILEQDMTRCERTLQDYSFLLETYCRTSNEAASLTVEFLNKMSIDEMVAKLGDIRREGEALASLPSQVSVGITTLDISGAVADVLSQVNSVQSAHYAAIPQLFSVLGEQLYQRVHSVKVMLIKKFASVKEYVDAIEVYNAAVASVPEVEKDFEYLVGLKNVIKANKIPTPDEMFGIESTLNTEYRKYQEAIGNFDERMEEVSKHFQKELLSRSKTILVPIEEIETSLASDVFGSTDSDADVVLQSLVKLEAKFKDVCDESAYLVKCQDVMKCYVFDGLQADRIQQQIVLYNIIWKAVRIVRSTLVYVLNVHFQDTDCLPLQMKVEAISKVFLNLEQHEHSPIEVWMHESLTLLRSLLPIISQLQSVSLTEDQRRDIEVLLNANIYSAEDASTWSGQALIDIRAMDVAEDIERIHHWNVCELKLQQRLDAMQSSLDKKEVQISQDRDISYRITNLAECSDFLEDLVITTKTALQSKYVKEVRDEYLLFYERVQECDQLVKWIILFQKEGLRLKAFYTNPKITRHINPGFKYFNIVDESWRSLIKVGRSDSLLLSLLSSSRLKNLDIINNALIIAYDVVYAYLETQRVNTPRLYFLSDTQCFDMYCRTDMQSVFQLTGATLFPNLSSINLGAEGETVFVEGVTSGAEALRFKRVSTLKTVVGDWIDDIDRTLTELVINDIKTLVTDERSIIEDARYPICTNQAKVVGLEVKFWGALKESFQNSNEEERQEIQKSQKTSILDNITILGTISSLSKDSYQVQSVANLIICLIQQRDLLHKTFGGSSSSVASSNHFDENAFFLECSIQKFYDPKTSEITVRHLTTEVSYGYKYLGFGACQSCLVVTPLTEKCFLAMSSTFHKSSHQIPFLRGPKHGSQVETLAGVTQSFGFELFPVDCASLDPGAAETSIKRCINGTLGGKFHACFINAEALSSESYAFLVTALTAAVVKLSETPKEKTEKSKFDLLQSTQSARSPHFSVCLGMHHTSEASYFPASIRKRFRPVHIISPRFSDVLGAYLEAYGFDTPAMVCVRLSAFLEHVSTSCAIDHCILMKLLIQKVIPQVGNSLVKGVSADLSQQCYLVAKYLFKHLPLHLHTSLNVRNIQYACSFYLNILFDPNLNSADFKGEQVVSACDVLVAALNGTKRCAIVIGGADYGKTSIIREAVGRIEGFGRKAVVDGTVKNDAEDVSSEEERGRERDDVAPAVEASCSAHALESRNGIFDCDKSYPKKLYRHPINPLLFSDAEIVPMGSSNTGESKTTWSGVATRQTPRPLDTTGTRKTSVVRGSESYTDSSDGAGVGSKKIDNKRYFDCLDRFLYDISSEEDVSYLHMDVTNSSVLSHYMNRLTHNCPNMYSPSLTSMGFKLIWECAEISHIDPAFASAVPIVSLPGPLYTVEDTLSLQTIYFLKKFDYEPTGEELAKGVVTPLVNCVKKCVELFVHPFLDAKVFGSLQAVQSVHVVIRTFFEIATAMYKYSHLDVSTLIHPQSVTVLYHRTHGENSVVRKTLWNQATFFNIMAFACMWSFGNCSPVAQDPFEIAYTTIREKFRAETISWGEKMEVSEGHGVALPPILLGEGEENYPYNEYCLQRTGGDGVEMKWVHWKQLTGLDKSLSSESFCVNAHIRRNASNFYCAAEDYCLDTLFVPTHLSVVSSLIKDALICDRQTTTAATPHSSSQATSCLAILGSPGTGRSSLLHMLARSMDNDRQWVGIISDDSTRKVYDAIHLSKDVYHCYLLENDLPFVGAFFIDDVNLDADEAVEVNKYGAELYTTLFSGGPHYDPTQRKWVQLENIMYAISATLHRGAKNQRVLQHCIAFPVPENGDMLASVFCSKFVKLCTDIEEDLAYDLASVTLNLFKQFRVGLPSELTILPLIRASPPSHQLQFVLNGCSMAFKNSSLAPVEVCSQWKRVVSNVMHGSVVEKEYLRMLSTLIDNSSSHRSNFKGIIYKGQANAGGSVDGSTLRDDESGDDDDDYCIDSGAANSLTFLSPAELRKRCSHAIKDVFIDKFLYIDFDDSVLWEDIQKCIGFLVLDNSPHALFWGPAHPTLSAVVASACHVARWSYVSFTMDGRRDLEEFMHQYIHSFCCYLLSVDDKELKLNSKFADTLRRHSCDVPLEATTKMVSKSFQTLWHIHLDDIDTDITSAFWGQINDMIHFKIPEMHDILDGMYDISFSKNVTLCGLFSTFLSHVKCCFSFGPDVDEAQAVSEMCHLPNLSNKMQHFYFSKGYSLSHSLVCRALKDEQATCSARKAVTSVVSAVTRHHAVKHSLFLELFENIDYEEGTFGMIGHIFQISVDEHSARAWDLHSEEFVKLTRGSTPVEGGGTCNEEDDSSGGHEDGQRTSAQVKLAHIVWACLSSRFFSMCEEDKREEMERDLARDLASNDFHLHDKDVCVIAYAYLHTVIDKGECPLSGAQVEMFDTLLLCGGSIPSVQVEFCSILLNLLSFGCVRVIGSSQHVARLLADMCSLEVTDGFFKLHCCGSNALDDVMSVANNQSDIAYSEEYSRNTTQCFAQSLLYFSSSGSFGCAPPTSHRTPVVMTNVQDSFCVDAYILFFLVRGFNHNQPLLESFTYFSRLAGGLRATVSQEGSSEEELRTQVLQEEAEGVGAQLRTLRARWALETRSVDLLCRGVSALFAAAAVTHPQAHREVVAQVNLTLDTLYATSQSLSLESVLHDVLTKNYASLAIQLDEGVLLVLKMNMLTILTESEHRICFSVVSQLFGMLEKRQGTLGLHASTAHNDDIIPTNACFDVMNMVFEYLNATPSSRRGQRLSIDELKSIFLENSEAFEEWANIYYGDHMIPLPDDVLDRLSYVERLVIVSVLKPIALDDVVSDGIFEICRWNVSLAKNESGATSSVVTTSHSPGEVQRDGTIYLRQNPSGAFDLTSDAQTGAIPCYFSRMHLARQNTQWSGNAPSVGSGEGLPSSSGEHIVVLPELEGGTECAVQYLAARVPAGESTVESESSALTTTISWQSTASANNVVVKKTNSLSLMWYNFPQLLRNALEALVRYHHEHSSAMTAVKVVLPKGLARAYWLLALFHVSALIRLQPFHVTVGDDSLRHAGRLLMQLRARPVQSADLLFSKLSTSVHQIYHQVYDVVSDSVYVKSISRALFDNVFTEDATDPDTEYYLLGLLPLPSVLNSHSVELFVEDVETVLSGGDCVHTADFIGCTNGELYEMHLKKLILAAKRSREKDMSFQCRVLPPGLLRDNHHRIVSAVSSLLSELPPLITVDTESDDVAMKSLCASHEGGGSGDRSSGHSRKMQKGRNHLWLFLQLEIESFNSSINAFRESLACMLDLGTCPTSAMLCLDGLERDCVPSSWLKHSFNEDVRGDVPLTSWVRQLTLRRKMLNVWLSQGYPEYIYLHLLQSPEGLVYALKQCLATSQGRPYSDVFLDARVLKLPYTSSERHSEISKINTNNMKSGAQTYSIAIAGVHLMNARWVEQQQDLEFLNPSFASKFSQELYIKMSATCEDYFEEEDLQCPVYAAPDFPTADTGRTHAGGVVPRPGARTPLFRVSIPTECPLLEWKKRHVSMHASPEWHVPAV